MKRILLIISFSVCDIFIYAQLKAVVANIETYIPVRDAVIYSTCGIDTITSWDGSFCLKDSFRQFSISHPHYITRIINVGEFHDGDTILLIPKEGYLTEVEVWGRRRNKNDLFVLNKTDAQLFNIKPNSVNFLGLFGIIGSFISNKKESTENKLKRILEDY